MQSRVKVLFVIHALGGGGAEKVLVNLAKGLSESQKYDVTVMTVVDSGIHRGEIQQYARYRSIFSFGNRKVTQKGSKSGSGSLLAGAGTIKKLLASIYTLFWRYIPSGLIYRCAIRETYDIEVAYLEGICTKLISHSSNKKSKKVAWLHIDMATEKKSHAFYRSMNEELQSYKKFNAIVAVSNGVRRSFEALFPDIGNRVTVLHNPIDESEIRRKAKEPCSFIDKQRKTFCSIGRLCKQKSFDRLIAAFTQVIKHGYDAELVILGEGPDEQSLKELIQTLKIEDRVKLLGYLQNPYPVLSRCDAYVCSSQAEGFSTTACEAAILGKPIITVDCAGMNELADVYTGVCVVENDTDSLARGMMTFLDSPTNNCTLIDPSYFDLAKSVSKVDSLFDRLLHDEN